MTAGVDPESRRLRRLQRKQLPGESFEQRNSGLRGRESTMRCSRQRGTGDDAGKGGAAGGCESFHPDRVSVLRRHVKRWPPLSAPHGKDAPCYVDFNPYVRWATI